MMLGDPEPAVAQLLDAAGQLSGLAQGLADGGARGDGRQVKDGEGDVDHDSGNQAGRRFLPGALPRARVQAGRTPPEGMR